MEKPLSAKCWKCHVISTSIESTRTHFVPLNSPWNSRSGRADLHRTYLTQGLVSELDLAPESIRRKWRDFSASHDPPGPASRRHQPARAVENQPPTLVAVVWVGPFSKSAVKHDKPDEKATTCTFIMPYRLIARILGAGYWWGRDGGEAGDTSDSIPLRDNLHKSNSICKWDDPIFVAPTPRVSTSATPPQSSMRATYTNFRTRMDATSRVFRDGLATSRRVVDIAFVWRGNLSDARTEPERARYIAANWT